MKLSTGTPRKNTYCHILPLLPPLARTLIITSKKWTYYFIHYHAALSLSLSLSLPLSPLDQGASPSLSLPFRNNKNNRRHPTWEEEENHFLDHFGTLHSRDELNNNVSMHRSFLTESEEPFPSLFPRLPHSPLTRSFQEHSLFQGQTPSAREHRRLHIALDGFKLFSKKGSIIPESRNKEAIPPPFPSLSSPTCEERLQ